MAAAPHLRTADWPLVGRRAEVERLANALRGSAHGVVLSGAAGVGKTRLAHECLRLAEEHGHATARVIATDAAASIPLGALAALLPVAEGRPERHADLLARAVDGLRDRAGDQRLVLLVDDGHLLDDASAAVLLHAAASGAVFVVATVRAGEAAPEPLTALWREGLVERIEVRNLGRTDVEKLLTRVLRGPVDGRTARDLFEASAGMPLFLRELVLGGIEVGLLGNDDGIWRLIEPLAVPPPLTELIEARLGDATPEERAVLEALAVGEPLELSVLLALPDAAAVDVAERRGLISVAAEERRHQVRLAHPLYGDVVRAAMTTLGRMTVNRLLADTLERGPSRRREDVLRLAVWRMEGGGRTRPDLMVEAARLAHFGHDDELAERLARAAMDAGGGVEAGLVLGEVLLDSGRHSEAEALLAELATAASNDAQRAMVAMKRSEALFWGLDREQEARFVLFDAEAELADAAWREELGGVRATYELLCGRPCVALTAVELLLDRGEGRPFVEAAIAAAPALAIMGRTNDAIALAERALAAHLALGDQPVLSEPGVHVVARVLAFGEAGRLAEADEVVRFGYEAAVDARLASGQAWFALMQGRLALLQGQLASASRHFLEAFAIFADLGETGLRRWCVAGLVLAAAQAADADGATQALATLDALPTTPMLMMEPDVERARAWHAYVNGDPGRARCTLEAAVRRARDAGAFALEATALHDLARIGAADTVDDRLTELADLVDGELTPARAAHARALTNDDGAALDGCADAFEAFGAFLFAAEAAAAGAAAHRRAGEKRRAQRSARRAAVLTDACECARTPALALAGPAGGLTAREREVALLAVEGLANAVIAERLVVSVRTVESHLQHAYEKLGVAGRDELPGVLVPDPTGVEVP